MKGILIILTILFITSCVIRQPVSKDEYNMQADLLVHIERCRRSDKISQEKYDAGLAAIDYALNTWDYDEDKFRKIYDVKWGIWKDLKGTSVWCEGTEKEIGYLLASNERHKQTASVKWDPRVLPTLSIFLTELAKSSPQTSYDQKNRTYTAPSLQNRQHENINVDVLPTPRGYEKSITPMTTFGHLQKTSFVNGVKLCEYNNGAAIRIQISQNCPNTLKP